MNKTEHLRQLILENTKREESKLSLVGDTEIFRHHILALKGINVLFFINSYYIHGDLITTKNCLYKIGMTNAYYHEVYNGEIFNVLDTFTYPVLSGSAPLINRYLRYDKPLGSDSFSTCFGKCIQAVYKSDMEGLQANIEGLEKWGNGEWEKNYFGITTAMKGFLKGDAKTIEQGVKEILEKHSQQNQPSIICDYINFEAAALVKLAALKGFDVCIESNLIPHELIKAEPNAVYEGYGFFDAIAEK